MDIMNNDGTVVLDGVSPAVVLSNDKYTAQKDPVNWDKVPVDNKIPISEIFVTIQGEGPYIGVPAIFVRVWGCNLACPTCDAWYTVPRLLTARKVKPEFRVMSVDDIVREVRGLKDKYPNVAHIVITGGEPLLYQKVWKDVLYKFVTMGLEIEWETNGTIIPIPEIGRQTTCYDVSPKLATFGGLSSEERIVDNVLIWHDKNVKSWFKFVVANEKDVTELAVLCERLQLDIDRVMLMPWGDTNDEIKQSGLICADACKKYGWRMTWRLQTPLWGTARMT